MRTMTCAALAALSLIAAPASAASYTFDLTGSVATGTTTPVDAGGFRFTFFTIVLSGFDGAIFEVGDEIEATVTLDQSLTVPTAGVRNGVDLTFLNTSYPGVSTTASGDTELFELGMPVLSGSTTTLTQDQLVNGLVNFGGSSFSFDFMQSSFVVDSLGAPSLATDTALLTYITVEALDAAVPEPATWATMVLGFGLLGGALRRSARFARA